MKKQLVILAAFLLPLGLMAQAPKKGPLDKKTFIIVMQKEGKKKPMDPDELKFDAAKVKCKSFADWGFTKPGEYKITFIDSTSNKEFKIYSWEAQTVNDIKEVMNWKGTITDEEIEGDAELIDAKGNTKYTYTYTGKLKGKPGKK